MSKLAEPPVAYSVPPGLAADRWKPVSGSRFLDHVGPILMRDDGTNLRYGFVMEPKHDNSQRRGHGGMIMTLCDDAMGCAAQASRPNHMLFTIGFDCQFISGALEGEFVEARCEVVRTTRSLVFMRSTCMAGDRVVATASGIWKVLA